MKEMVYLTSGHRIQRWPDVTDDNLHRLAIFGIRGGYLGQLLYRDGDIEKIISTLQHPIANKDNEK